MGNFFPDYFQISHFFQVKCMNLLKFLIPFTQIFPFTQIISGQKNLFWPTKK